MKFLPSLHSFREQGWNFDALPFYERRGALHCPEGSSTQYLRFLVQKNIPLVAFGTRVLKYWVLGPLTLGTSYASKGSRNLLSRVRNLVRRAHGPFWDLGALEFSRSFGQVSSFQSQELQGALSGSLYIGRVFSKLLGGACEHEHRLPGLGRHGT